MVTNGIVLTLEVHPMHSSFPLSPRFPFVLFLIRLRLRDEELAKAPAATTPQGTRPDNR